MLEKFIKTYSGSYRYTSMVRHKGLVIAFAMDEDRHIWYSILELGESNPAKETNQEPQSFLDVDAWQAAPTELIFPNEIAEIGFGVADQTLLPVFKKNSTLPEVSGTILPPDKEDEFDYFNSTTARFSMVAPFQVLSDGRYIYVFRQALAIDNKDMVYIDKNGNVLVNNGDEKGYVIFNKETSKNEWTASSDNNPAPLVNKTLLVDRFLLVGNRLTPKMEVRYQRSRSKTRPASRKDSLGPKDLDGNFFYEPTQELRFISNLTGGHFSVLLLPTAIAEIQRWQIFAENSETGRMDSYNVERSEDGLFNTRGTQTYTCVDHPQIYTRRGGICSESDCGKPLIPRIVTKGYSEWALKFNGSIGAVSIANNNFLDFEDEITVEAWIKPDEPTQLARFVAKDDSDGAHDYSLGINAGGKLSFVVTVEGKMAEVTSSFVMEAGTWYHIAGTFDGSALRIFVNGNKEKGETKATGKLSTSAKNLSFARSSSDTPSPFAGTIDEVRMWKRARSESELQADMHQRLTGLESDLVGYWRFDEGGGNDVHDQTSQQLDGVIIGAPRVNFNGSDDYIDLGEGVTVGVAFTQEAWIFPTAMDDEYHGFLGNQLGDNPATRSPSLWTLGRKIHAGFGDGTNWNYLHTKGEVLTLNTWNHVAVTFDGNEYQVYVNGEKKEYTKNHSFAGKTLTNTPIKYIGRVEEREDRFFKGAIEEVRIWERARAQQEIQADMNRRLNSNETANNLVGYWRLDEGGGNDVHDQSKNQVNGIIMGASWIATPPSWVGTPNGWVASDAPVGEHPGIERTSFRIKGRVFTSPPTSLLYYQQSKAAGGYSRNEKYIKNTGRVMLAVGTNDGSDENVDKNHIAALDFGISNSGRLAQLPDILSLSLINAGETITDQSINSELDAVADLEARIPAKRKTVDSADKRLTETESIHNDLIKKILEAEIIFYRKSDPTKAFPLLRKRIVNISQPVIVSVSELPAEIFVANKETSDYNLDVPPSIMVTDGSEKKQWRIEVRPDSINRINEASSKIVEATLELQTSQNGLADLFNEIQLRKSKLEDGSFVTMPRVQTDPLGLTISGGVLDFAWTEYAPLLFDSATGRLALYFRGKEDQFFVGYYDTFTERARITLLASGKDAVTCFSTSTAYNKVKMQIEGTEDKQEEALCTVKIKYGDVVGKAIISETWKKIPRDPIEFSKVLNGQATGHSYIGSGKAKDGELTLSDPGARRAINDGTTLMVGNERIQVSDQVFSGEKLILYEGIVKSTEVLPVFHVEYDYAVNATCEGVSADLSNGSILIRAVPVGNGGQMISNTEGDGVDLETSLVCKWTAAAPGSTISFDGKTQQAETGEAKNPGDFDATGDLTLETWVKPGSFEGLASAIRQQSKDSSFALALERLNFALELDGLDDTVEIPNAEQINFKPDQDFTVEAWIKVDDLTTGLDIIEKWADVDGYPYAIRYDKTSGKLVASRKASTFVPTLDSTLAVNDGGFHHIAYVKDGPKLRLYIDGDGENLAEINDTTHDVDLIRNTQSNSPLYFARRGGRSNRFKGSIDEVRIWKRARTLKEIQGDMNRRLSGDEANLVGYWHFRDGQAKDYSSFQNNGKIIGQPSLSESPIPEYKAKVCVGEKIAQMRELIPGGNWTHLAATHKQAYGLEFDVRDSLDCGNDSTLDINQDLTIEAFLKIGAAFDLLKSLEELNPQAYAELQVLKSSNPIVSNLLDDLASSAKSVSDVLQELALLNPATSAILQELYNALRAEQIIIRRGVFEDLEPNHYVPYSISINAANQLLFAFEDVQGGFHQYNSEVLNAGFHSVGVTRKRITDATDNSSTAFDQIKFYVDGKEKGSANYESTQPASDKSRQPVDVGNSNKPVVIGKNLKGIISEVRIWNVAHEGTDIGIGLTGNEKGLVAWWRFLEGKGNKTLDSKSQNHATINGTQWVKSPDPQGSSLKLYVNGQSIKVNAIDDTEADAWAASVDQFTLGARKSSSGFDQRFQGELEEVRIWGVTRTEEQIQDNLFRRILGEKEDLIAYYTFDAEVEKQISDYSLRGNHLTLVGGTNYVLSTAPVGDDTPQVRSALAGIHTPFSGKIGSAPSVQEYGDMQLDSQGNQIGVFKRCYSYIQNGTWQIITGYKVGDMVTEWIGQIQFAPQLIGFIEGAPPVPAENLTMKSVEQIGDEDDYNEASVIELIEAEETTYTYASSRESGFDKTVNAKLGYMLGTEANVGVGLAVKSVDVANIVGLQTQFEQSSGWLEDANTTVSRTTSKSTSLELRGRFGSKDSAAPSNSRFIPDNTGLALVKSETADIFALRLKSNGALIAYQMKPNPDIPKDWNLIHFPINPRYTKQGTLDGKLGLKSDVDYPNSMSYSPDSSYFKPIEAYTLKNRINRTETQLRTYFDQYAAGELGRIHFSEQDFSSGRMLDKLPNLYKHNLINTYVWTADGGLFAETQESMDAQEEMIGGAYAFTGMVGLYADLTLALFSVGAKLEAEAMIGGHLNLTVTKTQESISSFQMSINLDKVERDIYMRGEDGNIDLDTSDPLHPKPLKQPGKVDAYRFMSFYLEPQSDHFDDFFSQVVDPIWLEQSDDPSAVALRGARDDNKEKKPAPWRVMHRVTYVSRVLPPLDLSAPPSLEKTLQTLDIDSNYELIKQLDPYVRDHRTDFSDFSQAVDRALESYLPELKSHHMEIKQYLSLYYGIDEYMLPPEVKGISEGSGIEPTRNKPPMVKIGQYSEALMLKGKEISWTPDINKTSVSDDRLEKTEDLFLTWEFIPSEGQSLNDVKFGKYQTVEGQDEDEFVENSHEMQVTAWFMKKGKYRMRLTASDGILSASDETVLVVNEAPTIKIIARKPVRNLSDDKLSWDVELKCKIQTGLGDPSKYEDLKFTWNYKDGSENVVLQNVDRVCQLENKYLVHAYKKITFEKSGFYLLNCTVDNGSLASDSEINLEIAARVTAGLQALYTFKNGSDTTVPDVSGSATPLNLTVSEVNAMVLSANAINLTKAVKTKDEITLEAWIEPALDNAPGLRRILTLSNGPAVRNFILAQNGETFHAGLRTSDGSGTDGNASLRSMAGGIVKANKLVHLLFTREKDGKSKLYIDGEIISKRKMNGDFSHWDESFQLALRNELHPDGRADMAWPGKYHLVAIYDRALSANEITQNFEFGADRDLPPQISAGKDMQVNWSIPAFLDGNAWLKDGFSIDGQNRLTLDLRGIVRHDRPTTGKVKWSQVSAPPGVDVDFENETRPETKVSFPRSGEYKLRLTAEDDIGQVVSKEITINITHETPLVEINIPDENLVVTGDKVNTVMIEGDQANLKLGGAIKNSLGLDYTPGKLIFKWSCDSENVEFDDISQLETNVSFTKNGVYELMLTAENQDDKEKTESASMQITVNQLPVVDAGPDQNLIMSVGDTSISTQLDGTVSDDGMPDPSGILKLTWSVQDGAEDDVTILSENADYTDVQFKREGVYILNLEADDGAVKVSDTVKITVINSGMLPGGGRQAKVTREAGALHVRLDHNKHAQSLYHLKEGQEVTVIDLWTNEEGTDRWARITPVENSDKQPQWCAMNIGERTLLEFTE